MILKETILSAFTERGTLLKWLKKVEAALNNAVLTDISVEQVSATQVKLKFTFENGDFVESPVLTLPRGEKGEPGKDGAPGKDGLDGEGIAATIEVGTVTTGAAGTNASVTNVGTEQRAVLNFVIPRGDTGASGEEGSAGVGFDDASNIEIIPSPLLSSAQNGFNLSGTMKVTAGDEIFEIPSTMLLPLTSNDSIIIDVAEDGRSIEIHLDADIAAKLGRVLVTPMSAPASVSLVAVDTSNAQTMLTLGSGLSVSGGVLSASGGGGGAIKGPSIKVNRNALPYINLYGFVKTDHSIIGRWNGTAMSIEEFEAIASEVTDEYILFEDVIAWNFTRNSADMPSESNLTFSGGIDIIISNLTSIVTDIPTSTSTRIKYLIISGTSEFYWNDYS